MESKSVLESLGVVCMNPEAVVRIEAGSLADTVGVLGLASETLRKAVLVLAAHDPHGEDEALAELRALLLAQFGGTAAAALGLVEICRAQGVSFTEHDQCTRLQ